MKKNANPTLAAKWWTQELPDGLKTAKPFTQALDALEALGKKADAAGDAPALEAALKGLDAVDDRLSALRTEVEKAVKAAGKTPAAEPLQHTLDALTKAAKLLQAQRTQWQAKHKAAAIKSKASETDEEDAPEVTGLSDPAAYQLMLKSGLMRVRRGPVNFAVGLGKDASEHRLLVHPRQTGKSLGSIISKDSEATRITWGRAFADPDKPNTLVLAVESRLLSGLKRQVELLLKLNKPVPYTTVRLQQDGKDVADDEDDDAPVEPTSADASPLSDQLKAMAPALKALVARKPDAAAGISKTVAQIDALLKAGKNAEAKQLLDALAKAVGTAPTTTPPAPPVTRSSPTGAVNYAKARLAWLAARQKAQAELHLLREDILDTYEDDEENTFPDLADRIGQLDQILVTLNESLADTLDAALNAPVDDKRHALHRQAQQQIEQFLAYVEQDPLLANIDNNPFVPVTVRATLHTTLRALAQTLKT